MKSSKFNTFFKYENSQIGFNAFSQEFILLDSLLYDLYDASQRKTSFSELQEVHKEFYEFLMLKGFIIDEEVNEFEIVKQRSYDIDNDDTQFELIVNPTMNCNFKCWYCYETHIKDSKMNEDTISSIINFSFNVIENQKGLKKFILTFFGGEPLLYFNKVIKPLLISVSKKCENKNIYFSCGMTTNGLLINQQMLDVCKEYGLTGFQITLDGSKEQHDKVRFIAEGKGSYDKIVSNILLAVKNNFFVNVRINCSMETLAGLNGIVGEFETLTPEERKYIHFDIHKVWQVTEDIEHEMNDYRLYVKEKGFPVQGGYSNSVLESCYGDKRYQATINYNGEVFKCTARDFKNDSGEGILNSNGMIVWNEKYEKRLNSKFKNSPCKECRILPICGGGCTQQALEHEGIDYCVYNFDEDAKTQMVINKFIATIS